MIWAQHNAATRNLDVGKHRSRDVAGVHISSMWGDAADSAYFGGFRRIFWRKITENFGAQVLRIAGIKTSCDCGMAHYSTGHGPSFALSGTNCAHAKSRYPAFARRETLLRFFPGSASLLARSALHSPQRGRFSARRLRTVLSDCSTASSAFVQTIGAKNR